MNGWSPVGGQTHSAYVLGDIKPEDGPMGHSVSLYFLEQK